MAFLNTVKLSVSNCQDHDTAHAGNVLDRLWAHDFTLWSSSPEDIVNRLGWLYCAQRMRPRLAQIDRFVLFARQQGYTRGLLLGMGGSSLAPEVFASVFGTSGKRVFALDVLDTTAPETVLDCDARLDYAHTLFLVSTKSGTTVETLSLFKYFFQRASAQLGEAKAAQHFAFITDPDSPLVEMAAALGIEKVFLNDSDIGGRYAALSLVGLVPAGLLGVDLKEILDRAAAAGGGQLGARLGLALGQLAQAGRNKLTLLVDPALVPFGAWLEQLMAESTGKRGNGILPVDAEALGEGAAYGPDRVFAQITLAGTSAFADVVNDLKHAGHPIVSMTLHDVYDLGQAFFEWEVATAVACHVLGVNPFDQPDVEAAKAQTRKYVAAFEKGSSLAKAAPAYKTNTMEIYAPFSVNGLNQALQTMLDQRAPGAYLALLAFLPPTENTLRVLQRLRVRLRDRTGLVTTLGFGPRYLHSTGQLHKGDAGNGLFVVITYEPRQDVFIPNPAAQTEGALSFGQLHLAQALGDFDALQVAGRRVLHMHLRVPLEDAVPDWLAAWQ